MRKRIIMAVAAAVFAAVFTVLCVAVGIKNRTIREQRAEIARLEAGMDSLSRYNKALAGINGINVEVVFNLNQKNVLSFSANNCQNIAKEVAQMTRAELLDSLRTTQKTQ